ncbi:MAG: ABC transporter permease [Bacilli bacterium]
MYILKNAITSIKRNKGRNLLIGIIILVISCATAVTLAINNSSNSLIESYAQKYETEATIGINRENIMNNFDPTNKDESREKMQEKFSLSSNVSTEEIENYAESEYVKDYYYTMTTGVNSSTIEKVTSTTSNSEGKVNFEGKFGGNPSTTNGDFTLKGYSSIESMNEFIEGTYVITSGQVSEDFSSNDCLINQELATMNSLEVGSTITITDSQNENNTYTLTITGIYEDNDTSSDNKMSMFSNSANTIITNTSILKQMQENNSELNITITPTFILINSDVVDEFENELREKGLDENLTIETNLDQIASATSTISNVKTFAITFLAITLIIGTIVLLVINMINIRERKYEIGVLRTIGMKKKDVSLQFLYELILVAFAFLIIGAGIGALISVPISNSLLANEISSSQTNNDKIEENFGFGRDGDARQNKSNFSGVAQVQAFDRIDAVVDFKVLIELLVIGLIITIISGTSAMVSIQKFSPLTILKERT